MQCRYSKNSYFKKEKIWYYNFIVLWSHRLCRWPSAKIYLFVAARLTRSVRVACPNEPVRYECTLEGSRLKWKVIPRSANRMEQTFSTLNHQPNSSLDLTWSGFHVNLTLVSVTATTMTSTAEFLAVPEFRGTRFQCFGQHTNGELVLDIASEIFVLRLSKGLFILSVLLKSNIFYK